MAKIGKFEDIEARKAACEISRQAYRITRAPDFAKEFGWRDQVHRSTTELQSHLYVALDQDYLNKQEFDTLFTSITKCKNLVSGFARYLRSHSKSQNTEL